MSTGAIIAVVAAVLIAAAIVAAVMMQRDAGGIGLKRRFGPEYERTLARHDGDVRATRRELAERVKRYGGIEPRALPAQARERYAARWTVLQARFVDDPAAAVGDADGLIAQLASERGFPGAESPEHVDALSVHHPHHVHGYREAHAAIGGHHGTEDLRKSLVAARGLFDELLQTEGTVPSEASTTASTAEPSTEPSTEPSKTPDADRQLEKPDDKLTEKPTEKLTEKPTDRPTGRPQLGRRLTALTGRGRTEEEQ